MPPERRPLSGAQTRAFLAQRLHKWNDDPPGRQAVDRRRDRLTPQLLRNGEILLDGCGKRGGVAGAKRAAEQRRIVHISLKNGRSDAITPAPIVHDENSMPLPVTA
jgi:hypothetical protein